MWQRRQLKVQQRRRQLNPINSSSASAKDKRDRLLFSWLLVVTCFLAALVALLHDYDGDRRTPRHTSEWTLLARFLRDYPHRFAAFYAPKVQFVVDWSSTLYESVEISDDVTSALDFAVALVAIASVYHLIEIGRRAMLSRVQQTQNSKLSDNGDPEAMACDAF